MLRLSDRDRWEMWHEQGQVCPLCRQPIAKDKVQDRDAVRVDHIASRLHGGSDDWSNLQLAHGSCNEKKGCGCPNGQVCEVVPRPVIRRKRRLR